jgi:hypothetical protein
MLEELTHHVTLKMSSGAYICKDESLLYDPDKYSGFRIIVW